MAQLYQELTLTEAILDLEDMTITECGRDGAVTYPLRSLLEPWAGVDGVALTLTRRTHEVPTGGAA